MSNPSQKTLRDEQIKVTETMGSVTDVLLASKPYFEAALSTLKDPKAQSSIEVAPQVFRDLVLLVAAESKRAGALLGVKRPDGTDAGDSDWNPFKQFDFEFD